VYHVSDFQKIYEKRIVHNKKTMRKIVNTFYINFKKEEYFNDIEPLLDIIQSSYEENETIDKFNIAINNFLIDKIFKLDVKRKIGSDLGLGRYRLNERIIKNCQLMDATVYLSGFGAKKYNDPAQFIRENISLKYFTSVFTNLIPVDLIRLSVVQLILKYGSEYLSEKLNFCRMNRETYLKDE
jgi:hypothetical protein